MELICPNCRRSISPNHINVKTDLAKCEKCDSIHKASELVDAKSIEKINNPPLGTKMVIQKGFGNSVELFYPNKGFTLSVMPLLFFAIFWVGFICIWTFLALRANFFFAIFSIPFWIIGFAMIRGLINYTSETQTLQISGTTLTLKKNSPIKSKIFEIDIQDIEAIKMKSPDINPLSMFGNFKMMLRIQQSFLTGGLKMPAIISGVKTEHFFEDANDIEQEWVTSTLNNIIKRMKN